MPNSSVTTGPTKSRGKRLRSTTTMSNWKSAHGRFDKFQGFPGCKQQTVRMCFMKGLCFIGGWHVQWQKSTTVTGNFSGLVATGTALNDESVAPGSCRWVQRKEVLGFATVIGGADFWWHMWHWWWRHGRRRSSWFQLFHHWHHWANWVQCSQRICVLSNFVVWKGSYEDQKLRWPPKKACNETHQCEIIAYTLPEKGEHIFWAKKLDKLGSNWQFKICSQVLEKGVKKKCRRRVLQRSVGEGCCREV